MKPFPEELQNDEDLRQAWEHLDGLLAPLGTLEVEQLTQAVLTQDAQRQRRQRWLVAAAAACVVGLALWTGRTLTSAVSKAPDAKIAKITPPTTSAGVDITWHDEWDDAADRLQEAILSVGAAWPVADPESQALQERIVELSESLQFNSL